MALVWLVFRYKGNILFASSLMYDQYNAAIFKLEWFRRVQNDIEILGVFFLRATAARDVTGHSPCLQEMEIYLHILCILHGMVPRLSYYKADMPCSWALQLMWKYHKIRRLHPLVSWSSFSPAILLTLFYSRVEVLTCFWAGLAPSENISRHNGHCLEILALSLQILSFISCK